MDLLGRKFRESYGVKLRFEMKPDKVFVTPKGFRAAARFVFEAVGVLGSGGGGLNVSGDGAKVIIVQRDGMDIGI